MPEPEVSLQAYCKMILHAAKYPHAAVNGLLLAAAPKDHRKAPQPEEEEGEEESEPRATKKSTPLLISDAVPLFHQV